MPTPKYVFLDGFAGASGDMLLGALLDLGADRRRFKEAVAGLGLNVKLSLHDVERRGLRALKVDVHIASGGHEDARNFAEVERVVRRGHLPSSVADRAMSVFKRLFEAEARVHGRPFAETHLHEAAADDALVDIVGTCWLIEALDIREVLCSPLNVGSGSVKCDHGILPVPAPATAELLRGFPSYSAHASKELVTPTGAALVTTLASRFVGFPELAYDRIGYGAGGRDLEEMPNVLRAFYGDLRAAAACGKGVSVVETVIDDSSPALLAAFVDKAFALGALDVELSPVYMKKNRLGTKLTILAPADRIESLIEAVFRETTSIGVRLHPVERRVLERTFRTVEAAGEPVRLKIGLLGGEEVNIQPEYEDCLKAAGKTGIPLKDIIRLASTGRVPPKAAGSGAGGKKKPGRGH